MKILLFILAYTVTITSISSLYITVFRTAEVGIEHCTKFGIAFFFFSAVIIVAVTLIVKLHRE